MEIRWKFYCEVVANHVSTFHSSISIAGEVEEKEELKNLLKWVRGMIDREIFTYLKKLEIANFNN